MSVCCECCMLSGRGLCDELITRPEESYRLCCVVVCVVETSRMRRSRPNREGGLLPPKQTYLTTFINRDINSLLPSNDKILVCCFADGQDESSQKATRKIWKSQICTTC